MAKVADVTVRIGTTISGLTRGLDRAERAYERSLSRMENIGSRLSVSVSLPIVALGGAAVKAFGDLELLSNGLTSMLGDAGAAKEELNKLEEAAKLPGLGFEQAVRGSLQLQAVGETADVARNKMIQFGNALALSGKSAAELDGVVLALTQIQSADKLLTQDVRQLTSRIPQLAGIFKKVYGTVIPQEIAGLVKDNKSFVDTITKELEKLPRATPGVSNAFENLGIAAKRGLSLIGESVSETLDLPRVLGNLSEIIVKLSKGFTELPGPVKTIIIGFAALAAGIGPVLFGISAVSKGLLVLKQIQVLSTLQGIASGFLAMGAAAQVFTGVAVIAVIAAIAVAYRALYPPLTAAEQAQKALNKTLGEATASTAGQQAEVKALTDVLKDETASLKSKQAALNKLKQISPEYYGGLKIAKGNVEGLDVATKAYTKNLILNAKAQALAAAIAEESRKQVELRSNGAQTGWLASAADAVADFAGVIPLVRFGIKQTTDELNASEQKVQSFTKALEDLKRQSLETGSTDFSPDPLGGGEPQRISILFDLLPNTRGLDQTLAATSGSLQKVADSAFGNLELIPAGALSTPIKDEMQRIANALDRADELGKILGDSFDVTSEKAGILTSAIRGLVDAGFDEFSPQIQSLVSQLGQLPAPLEGVAARMSNLTEALNESVERLVEDMASALATGIGSLASGASSAGKFIGSLLSVLGSGMQQMGKLVIAYAITMEAFKKTFNNPLQALAAGIALTAIGGFVKSKAQELAQPPALANGGLAFGETYALVGDNKNARIDPEVISPLSKLKKMIGDNPGQNVTVNGSFRLAGRDLIATVQSNASSYSRAIG